MSLYIDMKMIRSLIFLAECCLSPSCLDFLDWRQRSVPWENLTLEHDWLSVKVVQLTRKRRLCKIFNSVRPREYRL